MKDTHSYQDEYRGRCKLLAIVYVTMINDHLLI